MQARSSRLAALTIAIFVAAMAVISTVPSVQVNQLERTNVSRSASRLGDQCSIASCSTVPKSAAEPERSFGSRSR